ncbi:hypothetical protein MCOR25_002454 [Pyricularia grisea]|uniref:BZIP domain-containing protein n=1 Tax=Pyricularia grisea TaxID=148305 RepID=A0A6P8BIA5_PYRGI|nr:uncharacterized protein PgNI_00939 [Pyricularia grisea]KAI6377730.1 hypothetical protein MCOR25_002454 [Pyricularia grisea]TLD16440.1 hypothetical protein PgNI_00939 [Pyricularia grisea]
MSSSQSGSLHNFMLTPQQQSLLFAALNANRANASPNTGLTMSPNSFTQSPVGNSDQNTIQESPFLDYDFSFDGADTSFDSLFDNSTTTAKMIGDLPGTNEKTESVGSNSDGTDTPEKRSHPQDDDDDAEKDPKRREGGEKVPKKPGRKPLTSEPTSKRKAQNRAAQRAFRERKEKHVKDLELKVEELEEISKAANDENSSLKAEVARLSTELKEYKKRLSLQTNSRPQPRQQTFGSPMVHNLPDVNFHFEFPKFGALPGPPASNVAGSTPSARGLSQTPSFTSSPSQQGSPDDGSKDKATPSSSYSVGLDSQTKDDIAKFSGIFSPPLTNTNVANASRGSMDSQSGPGLSNTSSPSASTGSHAGPSSSCGTSPEPFTQSPMGFKPIDTLTTIGEENANVQTTDQGLGGQGLGHFSTTNLNDIDWLSQANNFQFDPQLFGDYREPQQNIVSNGGLGGDFFNDAWDMDFVTPFNVAPSPVAPKKDLIAQIDAAKEDDAVDGKGELLTCNKIWEQLQNCPKVQNGDFDLDGLCSELQKKAKCSGYGAVVDQNDFQSAMKKYLGKNAEGCIQPAGAAKSS